MADIHKITKNGETILPVTTTDAIVHPQMETSLTNMLNEYNVSKLFPTGGVDSGDTYTLEGAIALLNSKLTASQKTVGIKLAFKDNGSIIKEYLYKGDNIEDADNWEDITIDGLIENINTISEYPCYNVLNPNKCLLGTYIDKNGNIDSTEVSGYFTIKIKAPKEEGLITLFGSTSFATYLVIKKDGSKRQIKYETKQEQVYTYQEDDEYVIVGLRVDAIDDLDESQAVSYIASNIGVYLGSSLPNKFIPYSITKDVQDNLDNLLEQLDNTSNNILELSKRTENIESAFKDEEKQDTIVVNKDSIIQSSYLSAVTGGVRISSGADTYYTVLYHVSKDDILTIHNDGIRLDSSIKLLGFFAGLKPEINSIGVNIYNEEYGTEKDYPIDFSYKAPDEGYIVTTIRQEQYNEFTIQKTETIISKHLIELDKIEKDIHELQNNKNEINADSLVKVIKNSEHLWMNKTILSYKKPDTEVDNISNFDNLMAACVYANNHANILNQYEIQVYEDVISNGTQDEFSEVPNYSGLYALFYINEYIKLRGIGTMKTIYGELLSENVTTHREYYETGHFDGGEIENLRIIAKNIRYPIHFERGGGILAQNKFGYIRYCDIIHLGGDEGIEGSETSAYKAWDAWGMGSSQGINLVFLGCNIIGQRHGFRCHTNKIFDYPTKIEFNNCTIIGYGDNAFNIDEYGCKCVTEYVINNCNIQGYINVANTSPDTPYVPYGIKICGSGNTTNRYKNSMVVKGLRLQSNNINISCDVITDDANLFGDKVYRKGENNLNGYVCGLNTNNSISYNLAKRLGDCSSSSKNLIVKIDNEQYSKIFDKDYRSFDNETILQELNDIVNGYGIFDLYDPNIEYYAELTDILFYKRNNTGSVISAGDYVQFNGIFDITKLDSSEGADAICISDCGIGEIGKFRTNITE